MRSSPKTGLCDLGIDGRIDVDRDLVAENHRMRDDFVVGRTGRLGLNLDSEKKSDRT